MGYGTYRDTIRAISPKWLLGDRASRLLYAFGLHLDLLVDATTQAVKRRMPGLTGYGDEIAIAGRERRIRRGRTETDASYTARMQSWLDDHAIRGGPYAMLKQLYIFFNISTDPGAVTKIELVYRTGARFTLSPGGGITRDTIPWLPSGRPAAHSWWLIFHWPSNMPVSDGNWDDADGTFWDDGGLWDSGMTGQDVADTRLVPEDWNRADAYGYICMLPTTITNITTVNPDHWSDSTLLATDGIVKFQVR